MRTTRGRDDGWTSEVASSLALAGFLFVAFLGFTVLAMGPLVGLDAYFNSMPPPPRWVSSLHVLDRVGGRAVCLPVLALVVWLCCRRTGSWRPLWVAGLSVAGMIALVLGLKMLLGRGQPFDAAPEFFVGGLAYPSGHTANIVLVYGLMAYLLTRYHGVARRTRLWLRLGVLVLAVVMLSTSLTLNWHWFADLVAGLLIGAVALQLTVVLDALVPQTAFTHGVRHEVEALRARWRGREPAT